MRRTLLSLPLALTAALIFTGVALPTAQAEPVSPAPVPPNATQLYEVLAGSDELKPSAEPVNLIDEPRDLNVTYEVDGQTYTLDDYLKRTTQGFVVLDGDKIVKEWYASGFSKDSTFQSWSMAKSFTSDAIGVAVGEGKIRSLDDKVTDYVPELAGSGYGDVTLHNLLRMASGVQWNETIDDIPLHLSVSLGLSSTLQFAGTRVRGWEPGTKFNYASMDTAVLALVLQRATGVPYYQYLQEKIWGPAGMASGAFVGNDHHGNNLGYCCIYATDRDFARFGKMMLDGGVVHGRQVVPADWVTAATTPSGVDAEYGLQWWIDGDEGYYASGLGDQRIYVSTKHNVVVVKSTFLNLDTSHTLPAFRAVAAEVARTR
jgi:CubicO group peptidase (beta-lactamase class C family)